MTVHVRDFDARLGLRSTLIYFQGYRTKLVFQILEGGNRCTACFTKGSSWLRQVLLFCTEVFTYSVQLLLSWLTGRYAHNNSYGLENTSGIDQNGEQRGKLKNDCSLFGLKVVQIGWGNWEASVESFLVIFWKDWIIPSCKCRLWVSFLVNNFLCRLKRSCHAKNSLQV